MTVLKLKDNLEDEKVLLSILFKFYYEHAMIVRAILQDGGVADLFFIGEE